MRYILDMVHHNPGEPPFSSAFTDPTHLVDYGFNGQVFKHINCIATFAAAGVDCFPPGSPEAEWLRQFTPAIEREIAAAKARGLKVFYHLDLFVLPKRLVEHYRAEICHPQTGRILLDRPKTLELHRILFAELTARFPEVDGYVIRVGETYLFDTPHHAGNGPIPSVGPTWTPEYLYPETLAGTQPPKPSWTADQADAYVQLLRFLREEICVRHGKQLFFRTWDMFPDKLHASLQHYLEVTDQVEPHRLLAFSIKHTSLDFWRRVKVNECLTRGKHPQIIEVQCQREYEGKGAYPNYVMEGVINGFEENSDRIGLKDLLKHPTIAGVFCWSRGGGWYGPYLGNELWPDLNAFVLARFVGDPSRSEAEIFHHYATHQLQLQEPDATLFRRACLLSAQAVLKTRYCQVFDNLLCESVLPTGCWMRDDRLGGNKQLGILLDALGTRGLLPEALREKQEAVSIWEEIRSLMRAIQWPSGETPRFANVSATYGLHLSRIIEAGWKLMALAWEWEHKQTNTLSEIETAIDAYDRAWDDYKALTLDSLCPSLYRGKYFNLPGTPEEPGLDATVDHYRNLVSDLKPRTGLVEPRVCS